ncbi:MAG: exodeoxyribonuclease V subunit alpha [Syntrophobacterales bacterium]|nr:exodeoxyribonuclease V subunit alpha [Syntrophobacterales bacterium]
MKSEDISRLCDSGMTSCIDIHFARLMTRLAARDIPGLSLAAALVSSSARDGNICLDLSTVAGKELLGKENDDDPVICPGFDSWCTELQGSSVVGNPGEYKPLILDNRGRLYLFRYWDYQEKLAGLIKKRIDEDIKNIDHMLLKEGLERLFPDDGLSNIDWQKVAAFTAVTKKFCVISGGPGTGKTATVAKILALLIEQKPAKRLRIALAAPTGKAAARLREAIEHVRGDLDCTDDIKEKIPVETSTIHRLLGTIRHSPYFRYNDKNTLPVDVVVVDEASMVDLPLMSKLVQALPSQSLLILLGDKDQLSSVEAGAVLGDTCDTGNRHGFSKRFCDDIKTATGCNIHELSGGNDEPGLQDCIVELRKNYRFRSGSGISMVSRAVNEGADDRAAELLSKSKFEDITWVELPAPDELSTAFGKMIVDGFKGYLEARDPREIFRLLNDFRILCAVREGPYGVVTINKIAEQILGEEKLIKPEEKWYQGRPIMITRNDYNLHLFNGDVGVVLTDPMMGNERRAFFTDEDGTWKKFHPLRLPEHETVYAMTVHKSQGSEFNRIALILPDRQSPVLTRELIYTGITRAKENVTLYGTEEIFRAAVARRIERTSGLRDALWED